MTPEAFRALAVMCEPPGKSTATIAEALGLPRAPTPEEYTDLFVMQLSPYASIYLGADGMLGGDARDRVAGFWRALGITPPTEADHLAALLGLYATLCDDLVADRETVRAQRDHARRALLWEHLLSWVPPYLRRVREVGPSPYRAWATVLEGTLDRAVGKWDSETVGRDLPLHLREARDLPQPDTETLDHTLAALLSPVRAGFILTKHDLTVMARQLGIGLRQGERKFILRALVDQDPVAVFQWLEGETRRQRQPGSDAISRFWNARNQRTEHLLHTMRRSVEEASTNA